MIRISDQFDSGNIELLSAESASNIRLKIRKDNASNFYQWFHFRLEAEPGQHCSLSITNCAESAYPSGWENYQVCVSYDRQDWFRTPTTFVEGELKFQLEMQQSSVYFAYFAPYSHERHLDLIASAESDKRVVTETLGLSLDGHAMHLLKICDTPKPKNTVWMIARQHPGETMAEWFVEGFLQALLDENNPLATQLLQTTAFYLVPNMNPDGSIRGNLRTNSAGANLNREWQTPSMETSPEVYLVRERMMQVGGDMFLDIHGDEALPYNFVAGSEGTPNFNEAILQQQNVFTAAYEAISPDFQTKFGYPVSKAGEADLRIATNWLGNHFKTLSFTLEMPFKDNDNLPNLLTGWSPLRSAKLGADMLFPIKQTLANNIEKG